MVFLFDDTCQERDDRVLHRSVRPSVWDVTRDHLKIGTQCLQLGALNSFPRHRIT